MRPKLTYANVVASLALLSPWEEEPTSLNWALHANAICADVAP